MIVRGNYCYLSYQVTTTVACEKLEKDRTELQAAYEGFVQKLNQQHQSDVLELEERLKQFYTAECEKLQSICIEEAEKYKAQLQEQVSGAGVSWTIYLAECLIVAMYLIKVCFYINDFLWNFGSKV